MTTAASSAASEELLMARERFDDDVDVLGGVVRVRRDPQVAVSGGRDDSVAFERFHESGRVGRCDAEERASPLWPPGRHDSSPEPVESLEEPRMQTEHVLACLR